MANDDDKESKTNGGADPTAEAAAQAQAQAQAEGAAKAKEPSPQTIEDMITQLEQQSQKLEQTNKELQDRLLRTAADFENYKKRTKKELDESSQKGREALLKEVLPVMDNLERALKHAAADDPLAQGVRMVEKQLLSALEKFGVSRFSAAGKPFDPALHDAIQQIETNDFPPGSVAQEFSSGYMSGNKLLRAAMVAVAKAKEGA
jgi:molecular chaperone GrpE